MAHISKGCFLLQHDGYQLSNIHLSFFVVVVKQEVSTLVLLKFSTRGRVMCVNQSFFRQVMWSMIIYFDDVDQSIFSPKFLHRVANDLTIQMHHV